MHMHQELGSPLCMQCKACLSLVVQIYCPLNNSQYHRTLYVYCCTNHLCWTSSKKYNLLLFQKAIEFELDQFLLFYGNFLNIGMQFCLEHT